MSSTTVEPDGTIVNQGYSRNNIMANADVSVSRKEITRNQIVHIHKKFTNGKSIRYKLYPYSEDRYDFINDILSMNSNDQEYFLSNRYFEVVVDEQCLESSDCFMKLANQMERLEPVFGKIQNLMIKIIVANGGCPAMSHEQYTATDVYNCLAQVCDSLNYLKASSRVELILALPEEFDFSDDECLKGYILPFYQLDTNFRVKIHEFGDLPKDAYGIKKPFMDRVWETNKEIFKEERLAKRRAEKEKWEEQERLKNAVVVHESASAGGIQPNVKKHLTWAEGTKQVEYRKHVETEKPW